MGMQPDIVEQQSLHWHDEEPFSSRPIQMLSTLYLFKRDHALANRWMNAGSLTDPKDRGLLINLAFTQACQNLLPDAAATIKKLRHLYPNVEPFVKATEGLIEYARGNFELGDRLYEESMTIFQRTRTADVATYCRVTQALMAIDRNHPRATEIIEKANKVIVERPSFNSLMLIKTSAMSALEVSKNVVPEQRRLSQWIFDPNTNTLTNRPGITATGAKGLIVLDKN